MEALCHVAKIFRRADVAPHLPAQLRQSMTNAGLIAAAAHIRGGYPPKDRGSQRHTAASFPGREEVGPALHALIVPVGHR